MRIALAQAWRRGRGAALQWANTARNEAELGERRLVLSSTPQHVFLQVNAPCNADCVFCSKGRDYPIFRLTDFLARFGTRLDPVLRRSRRILLTGSGEFLGTPEAPDILRHFNREYPHVDKFLATNGSYLGPELCALLARGGSRYTVQLSWHAPDAATHRAMTRTGNFDRVRENVRRLLALRRSREELEVHFMFCLTSLNAEKLPEFVRFAHGMGADRVKACYFSVYEADQESLSLYHHKDLANRVLAEARDESRRLGLCVELPPAFGAARPDASKPACCGEPWRQIMINPDGHVLPCDLFGACPESLADRDFPEIWNGPFYQELRRGVRDGGGCLAGCLRHSPQAVDDWEAHLIPRSRAGGRP